MHPNEERIRAFYQAVATRDTDLLTAMMAEDMVTTVPGHSPVAGRREGREAVLGLLGRAFEETAGNFSAELLDVLANDRYAVTLHRWTAQRKGRQLVANNINIFRFDDQGRIAEREERIEDITAHDEFWST
ncbi:nuclear transport factor 2 family protein [Spirillospora sp. NBC_00431]